MNRELPERNIARLCQSRLIVPVII